MSTRNVGLPSGTIHSCGSDTLCSLQDSEVSHILAPLLLFCSPTDISSAHALRLQVIGEHGREQNKRNLCCTVLSFCFLGVTPGGKWLAQSAAHLKKAPWEESHCEWATGILTRPHHCSWSPRLSEALSLHCASEGNPSCSGKCDLLGTSVNESATNIHAYLKCHAAS